ncbi:ROK family protein [Mycoplasma elephantis]|uniref:ROK family protein n=1 Tax=Mycoplasma elephantis TaxID=114882 RepID=UPI000482E5D0|nr:ROK family protein [Mycoplasma elephantis]
MKENNYKFAAVDIGGTNVRFATFDKNEKIKDKLRFDVDVNDYKKTLNKIIELINKYEIDAIGMDFPGPADYKKGIAICLPNLISWNGHNLKEYLLNNCKRLKKVECDNDANVMGLANHYYFKRGINDVTQFYTLSTGFGAGLIINNKIYTGAYGLAQEIARAPWGSVYDEKTYHLLPYSAELYVSGTGISLRAKTKNKNWSTKEVFANYENDNIAKQVIDEGIDTLARTISSSMALLNPNLFVFGGAVARYNKWFVEKAIEKAKEITEPTHFKNVEFKFEELGDDSALYGLYYLIKHSF